MKISILAAGKSERIFDKIKKNKCLVIVNGNSLIKHIINNAKKNKINNIDIIVGFKSYFIKKNLKRIKNIRFIYNKFYKSKEMMYSFYLSLKNSNEDTIICYSDIFFKTSIFTKIIKKKDKQSVLVPVLTNWKKIWKIRNKLNKNDAEDLKIDKKNNILNIGQKIKKNSLPKYQFMGIIYIPKELIKIIVDNYKRIKNEKKLHTTNFLDHLIKKKINVKAIKYNKDWYEFDDIEDFSNFKNYKW